MSYVIIGTSNFNRGMTTNRLIKHIEFIISLKFKPVKKHVTMRPLLLFIFCFGLTVSHAQFGNWGGGGNKSKIKGKISGQLVDSLTNEPVPYATIVLTKAGKTKEINGLLSEDDGKFKLTDIAMGKYDMAISFLGYEEKKITNVELTGKSPDYDLGKIQLVSQDYVLGEVQITEKRSLYESKVDKIVFNAEDDASVSGGDAADVLRKVPTLSVDLEGNVSLRGSQNVRILINGKPSGMFSSNVADALKMFPADQIKKVEVITSPGAKYDGEGSAGIINIITKKDNVEGIAGSLNASLGNRQSNANGSLNVGKGRFGFSTSGFMYYSHPRDAENCFVRSGLSSANLTDCFGDISGVPDVSYAFNGVTNTSRLGFNTSASAFYDFNAYNAINTSISYRGFRSDQNGDVSGQYFTENFMRETVGDQLMSGYDWNTDYTKKFEGNDKQELSFAVQVSGNIENQESDITEQGPFARRELQQNDGDNLELTGQVDYVHPIGKSNKLEVGAKVVQRNIDSDSDFSNFNPRTEDFVIDQDRSNVFLYDQNVYAGYASYNFFFKKLNFVTGVRYERTEIAGNGEVETQNFTNSYNNILPNFAVSKSLKGFRNLKFSFSKRIQRPSLFYINPFVNTADIANVVVGNPLLNPEITDQYEISYNTNFKGFMIFSSFYNKRTSEIIEAIIVPDGNGINLQTYSNVGKNNSFGINLFTTKSIGKLTIRGGGDIYTYNATGVIDGVELSNEALSYRIFSGGEYSFTGTLKADFFGFFQAPRFTLQGETASFSMYGFGFRKDLKDWSLGLRVIQPFAENLSFDSDITGTDFRQISRFNLPFRSIGINVRYKFGKVDFKERKSKIKNSDQKQGEGGGGDGGGQGGGQQQG
jgi:outer membrane receptor protein involved in Fe transport